MGFKTLAGTPYASLEEIQKAGAERAIRRYENREHLRLEIQSRKHINEMEKAAFALFLGYEEDALEPGVLRPIGRERAASLKAAADIAEKLLRKVLPDLKQIEMQTKDDKDDSAILQDIELSNRLRLYIQSKAKRGEDIAVTAVTSINESSDVVSTAATSSVCDSTDDTFDIEDLLG